MGFIAIVAGATGLTGGFLLSQLLEDARFDVVVTLSRKRISNPHPKHINYIVDLFEPASYQEYVNGDHLFICTGTTAAKTPDKEQYYRIEHDLPLALANVAKANGMQTLVAISALGANPDSRIAYNRGKGMMERDIEDLGFAACYFVQPALIGGDRDERRPLEKAFKIFQKIIDPLLVGSLRKYRTIRPEIIAQSMIAVSINGYKKSRIESDELVDIARS
jgi:uncharacterized protein YbjT (DUF2867 family)